MRSLILYDGECFLCNSFINYIIENDNSYFLFIDQRSEKFLSYQKKFNLSNDLNTIYLIENEKIYSKSEAIKLILKKCGFLGKLISFTLNALPNFISNYVYECISKNRLFFFKRKCIIPNKNINSRTI